MKNEPNSNKKLFLFIGISFVLALIFQTPFVLHQDRTWLKLTMWAPTIAFLITSPRQLWIQIKSFSFKKLRFLPLALVTGWLWSIIYFLILALSNNYHWNEKFELATDGRSILGIHDFGMLLGVGEQSFTFFVLNLLLTVSFASVLFGLIGGLGEELGWRGYLQLEISKKYGVLKGTVVVGLVWGLWHLPANLAGLNNATYPVVNALITFPLFTIALSSLFGWLQRKTESAYFPAFAHGANNCIAAGFLIKPKDSTVDIIADVLSSIFVIGFVYGFYKLKSKGGAGSTRT